MSIFNYDSPFMQFLSRIFDVILLNVLWIVCCLPLFTVGASTTAMYTVLMKLVRGEDYAVLRNFFKAFKDNFAQATAIWAIFVGLFILLGVDIFFCYVLFADSNLLPVIMAVFIFLLFTVAGMAIYAFPLQACFENKIRNTVKNSLLFCLSHVFRTIFMLVLDVLILGVTLLAVQQMLLFAGIMAAVINATILKKIFTKYMEPAPAIEE